MRCVLMEKKDTSTEKAVKFGFYTLVVLTDVLI